MKRRVIVVDGPLAFGMRRFQAAGANEVGLEILTLPLLASRLAGGFRHLADRETLSMAVASALRDGGFAELDAVRNLPGMVRAALQSLDRAWNADLDLENLASTSARVADLAMLQRRTDEGRGAIEREHRRHRGRCCHDVGALVGAAPRSQFPDIIDGEPSMTLRKKIVDHIARTISPRKAYDANTVLG